MKTHSESGRLNGQASLYLMIGHLQARADHFETGLSEVASKVERLERSSRRKIVPRGWMSSLTIKDLGGFLLGATILTMAIAGEWDKVGQILRGFAK
jgi:hypothetical protein